MQRAPPAGDIRAVVMIERLIQTIKRQLSFLNNDPKWSKITLADKIAEIIQELKLIPKSIIKIAPFTIRQEKQHTTIQHNNTNTSKNLSYKGITIFYLNKKRGLNQSMLNAESIWNLESDSEQELDVKIQEGISEDDASDHSTLPNLKRKLLNVRTFLPKK